MLVSDTFVVFYQWLSLVPLLLPLMLQCWVSPSEEENGEIED
jgi:hypothetical protein